MRPSTNASCSGPRQAKQEAKAARFRVHVHSPSFIEDPLVSFARLQRTYDAMDASPHPPSYDLAADCLKLLSVLVAFHYPETK